MSQRLVHHAISPIEMNPELIDLRPTQRTSLHRSRLAALGIEPFRICLNRGVVNKRTVLPGLQRHPECLAARQQPESMFCAAVRAFWH